MKNALFVILLFLSFLLFAEGGASLGLKVAPLYSYRSLSETSDLWNSDDPDWGYTLGVELKLPLSNKFQMYTGFNYSNSGSKAEGTLNTVSEESPEGFSSGHFIYRDRCQYLSVPVLFGYKLNTGKVEVTPILGLKSSYLLKYVTKAKIEYDNGGTNKESGNQSLEDFNRFNIWGQIAIDISYVKDSYAISFRPLYEHMLVSNNNKDSGPLKTYLYNWGAALVFALKL